MNLGPKMAEIRGKNRKPMKIDLPLYNSKICGVDDDDDEEEEESRGGGG